MAAKTLGEEAPVIEACQRIGDGREAQPIDVPCGQQERFGEEPLERMKVMKEDGLKRQRLAQASAHFRKECRDRRPGALHATRVEGPADPVREEATEQVRPSSGAGLPERILETLKIEVAGPTHTPQAREQCLFAPALGPSRDGAPRLGRSSHSVPLELASKKWQHLAGNGFCRTSRPAAGY